MPTVPEARTEADVAHAVAKLLRVPDRYRVFEVSAEDARAGYPVDEALLTALRDAGLPSRGAGAEARFDALDLQNVALSLRLNTPWFASMRWWASSLTTSRENDEVGYRVGVRSRCAECAGAGGGCPVVLAPELLRAAHATDDPAEAAAARVDLRAVVRLPGRPPAFAPPVADVLRLADPLEWHLLPDALVTDLGFLRGTGLADCRLAAHYLHREAQAAGVPVRRAFGLIVTVPFSATHHWVEFEVDGRWLPADPLLLASMARWGVLDGARWPPTTSPLGMMWRIGEWGVHLARHHAAPAHTTLPTTRLTPAR
ncbi:hypothetical protein GCM10027168_09640 [Streptomyces capparidis]